ncbi:MAG: hypothetical protein IID46_06230 [Planctomycetes bacterium]|nr:hypothetical protein [Planctomycetota bacterium]
MPGKSTGSRPASQNDGDSKARSAQQVGSGKRSRLFGSWDNTLYALILLWVFLLGCTQMRSTDTWTHIRTGQLILELGHVPWVDWYTYTDSDNTWIDLHWLFQLLMAMLYALGGVGLLVLTKALCLAVTVAIGWSASGRRLPTALKAACWIMPIICLSGRALVRPEMLTLIFLAVWLWILLRADERPRLLWWLPVVQIVWTNCHGLFVLGPVVGAAYFADRVFRQLAGGRWGFKRVTDTLPFSHLLIVGTVTLLASLINPYFEEGAVYPIVLYGELTDLGPLENRPPINFVREHGFDNVYLLAEMGVWITTACSFIWLAREKRCDLLRLLSFLGFSVLAWQAQRNTNIFALVSAVMFCANCGEALKRRAERLARLRSISPVGARTQSRDTAAIPSRPTGLTLFFCGIFTAWSVCVVTNVWSESLGDGMKFGIDEKEDFYIHAAARFAGQPGFPERAFVAQFGQAAVYNFHNAPQHKVFLDGRLDVISHETEAEYYQILQAIAERNRVWEVILRDPQGNLPVIILDSRDSRPVINGLYVTPGWRIVFADATAAVFLDEDLADKLNLPAADPAPLNSRLNADK